MPTVARRRPRFLRKLASIVLPLACVLSICSPASAQFGGRLQRYSERFYGQNFYDGQRTGILDPTFCDRQHHAGFYGPPQMYSRQYVDEYGYGTAGRPGPALNRFPIRYDGYGAAR